MLPVIFSRLGGFYGEFGLFFRRNVVVGGGNVSFWDMKMMLQEIILSLQEIFSTYREPMHGSSDDQNRPNFPVNGSE